jgi:hypothetical protein
MRTKGFGDMNHLYCTQSFYGLTYPLGGARV